MMQALETSVPDENPVAARIQGVELLPKNRDPNESQHLSFSAFQKEQTAPPGGPAGLTVVCWLTGPPRVYGPIR